jgi:hypothetical protein
VLDGSRRNGRNPALLAPGLSAEHESLVRRDAMVTEHVGGLGGIRGLRRAARSSIEGGWFGRLFRTLPPAGHMEDELHELALSLIEPNPNDVPIIQSFSAPDPPSLATRVLWDRRAQ